MGVDHAHRIIDYCAGVLRSLPATITTIVIAAFAVAGCGAAQTDDSSKDFKGDQQTAAKVIEDLESAITKKRKPDTKKICTKLITDKLARKIAAQERDRNCDDRLKKSLEDVKLGGGIAELEVLKVTVDGDKAIASVKAKTGDRQQTSDYTLERSGDSWRISEF
jgi:hypothetical protein